LKFWLCKIALEKPLLLEGIRNCGMSMLEMILPPWGRSHHGAVRLHFIESKVTEGL
jgi:hypothetical protein